MIQPQAGLGHLAAKRCARVIEQIGESSNFFPLAPRLARAVALAAGAGGGHLKCMHWMYLR